MIMESVNERLKDLRYAVGTEKLTQDNVTGLTGIPFVNGVSALLKIKRNERNDYKV